MVMCCSIFFVNPRKDHRGGIPTDEMHCFSQFMQNDDFQLLSKLNYIQIPQKKCYSLKVAVVICDPCQADFISLLIAAARSWTIASAGLCFQTTAYISSLLATSVQSNAISLHQILFL